MLVVLMPVGLYYCCSSIANKGKIFVLLYGVTAIYFSSVMIRLMLVLAPAACILGAIGLSELLREIMKPLKSSFLKKETKKKWIILSVAAITIIWYMILNYLTSCTYIAAEGYSSPSVILGGKSQNG